MVFAVWPDCLKGVCSQIQDDARGDRALTGSVIGTDIMLLYPAGLPSRDGINIRGGTWKAQPFLFRRQKKKPSVSVEAGVRVIVLPSEERGRVPALP